MTSENIPWNAIAAFFRNEADEEQLQQIRTWLKKSPDHPRLFREIADTWKLTQKEPAFYEPDSELLWEQLMLRIRIHPSTEKRLYPGLKWVAAAAVVVLVFIAGVWIGGNRRSGTSPLFYTSVMAPSGSRTQIVLPDSTTVWLNSGASIRYPAVFQKSSRDVEITGECFFDVTKDPQRQFIVHAADFNVNVFGTSFNIRENRRNNQMEVALIEGNVRVFTKAGHPLTVLEPGEQFIYKEGKGLVTKIGNMEALTAWKNNMLIFEDEPFEKIVQTLEGWYGVKFEVDAAVLNNHRYTFRVKTESLKEVLELISVITPIAYTVAGEKVTVKYQ
ncbi:MAG: DUF4974 domain-containing protein [Mangrovibacterium sp.]|nr:DUF4974 domain-containing protein [Mangrovibacterium sp.]